MRVGKRRRQRRNEDFVINYDVRVASLILRANIEYMSRISNILCVQAVRMDCSLPEPIILPPQVYLQFNQSHTLHSITTRGRGNCQFLAESH